MTATIVHVHSPGRERQARTVALTAAGFRVIDAYGGEDAIRVALSEQAHVVVCSAPEMVTELRRESEASGAECPVVLLIVPRDIDAAVRTRVLHHTDVYLVEPVDEELLVLHVRTLARLCLAEVSARNIAALAQRQTEERDQAIRAVRESEERFRSMADGAPVIIWVTDAVGDNRFVNRAYREFFGVTMDNVEGRKWQPLLHADDADGYLAEFQRAINERKPFRAEARVRRADGEWRWIASSGEPRFSAAGEFLGHGGISADITDRKRAEEALRRSAAVLAQAGEMADLGAWYIDLAGGDVQEQTLHWSEQVYRIFGYAPGEVAVTTKLFFDHVHPDDRELVVQAMARALSESQPYAIEHRIVGRDRRERIVFEHAEIERDTAGRPRRVIGAVQDITERRLAENALRANEGRWRALTRASSQVLYRTSPDFRELLEMKGGSVLPDSEQPVTDWVRRYVYAEDRDLVSKAVADAVRTGGLYEVEHRVLAADGIVRWVSSRAVPVRDAAGQIVEWFGAANDISARRWAEDALRDANARLRLTAGKTSSSRFCPTNCAIRSPPSGTRCRCWSVNASAMRPVARWR